MKARELTAVLDGLLLGQVSGIKIIRSKIMGLEMRCYCTWHNAARVVQHPVNEASIIV